MFRAALVAFLLVVSAHAETLSGRVVGITDGDTLTVLDANHQQHKIRLAGIDAPEHDQAFGERAKHNLAALAFNKDVAVNWRKVHRKRLIGRVVADGVDVSLEQVKAGMAWWYEKYRKEQSALDRRLYGQAEHDAKTHRVGLWSDPDPIPPWEWRHRHKTPG
ncbi:MAG TPA: thermonuclease family protein [Azonexus sp.]|nr:thermonuclease family protein [Azonexus sp.]